MGIIKRLLTRFRQSAVLVLIGFFLIIYIAFGFVYFQQSSQQKELEEQTTNISLILTKPLPNIEKLQAEYDEVSQSLAPMTDSKVIAMLVSIAEESGIDIDESAGKFRVPSAAVREEKVGEGNYEVLSFKNISVQGNYNNVMAFISDLDSGETLKTMVLKRVTISQIEIKGEGEEEPKIETVATLDVDIYTKLGGDSL